MEAFGTSPAAERESVALPVRDRPHDDGRRLSIRSRLAALPDGARPARAPHRPARRALATARGRRRSASRAGRTAAATPVVVGVRDELCPWNEGAYRLAPSAGRTDDDAGARAGRRRSRAPCTSVRSTSRTSLAPTACDELAPGAARARFRPRPHSAPAVLPGGVLMFDVRPTENLEDFQRRVPRDRPVLRRRAERGARGEVQPEPAVRADARRARGRLDRRRRRCLPVRAVNSGRDRALRGRHRRRRVPDAPSPRRSPRDDARAARRHPRARRADRGPLGVRGDDLRALRLRDGVGHRRDLAGTRALAVRAAVRAARSRAAARADRGARAAPADLGACASADTGDVQARAAVVGEPGGHGSARAASGWRPEALRAARARRRAAGVCDLPPQHEVGRRLVGRAARRDRGDRRDSARDRGDLALPARRRLAGVDRSGSAADRPPALLPARDAAKDEVPRERRDLGAPRRRRRGALGSFVRGRRRGRVRGRRRVRAVERRSLEARRTARASAPTTTPTCAAT